MAELQQCKSDSERRLLDFAERRRQVMDENAALQESQRLQKEEIRHLHALLQQRDLQYRHALKKKDTDINAIKQRLVHLVAGILIINL